MHAAAAVVVVIASVAIAAASSRTCNLYIGHAAHNRIEALSWLPLAS